MNDRDALEACLDKLTKAIAAGIAVLLIALVSVHTYRYSLPVDQRQARVDEARP